MSELPKPVWERRKALRHWLEIQARAAVEEALMFDEGADAVAIKSIRAADRLFDGKCESLRKQRDCEISYARRHLTTAELLHREIVRRGGKI